MSDYGKLVKELRGCKDMDYCTDCPRMANGYVEFCNIKEDAAAAIEDLQAQLPKQGEWVETEEKEWGIYPFKKQTCSVCDCKIDHIFMLACMDYFDDRDTVFHYCPNCGAKMEVQDGK